MNPQVRAMQPSHAAAPRTSLETPEINAVYIAKPVVEIKAPSPEVTEEPGPSMLDKRRRRRARLSNRH